MIINKAFVLCRMLFGVITFRTSLARCVRTLQYGQNDCTIPPVFVPSYSRLYSGYRGRPYILLNLETVELLRCIGNTWNEIASSLQVNRTTLSRRIREGGYEIERFTDISESELDTMLRELQRNYPFAGIKLYISTVCGISMIIIV